MSELLLHHHHYTFTYALTSRHSGSLPFYSPGSNELYFFRQTLFFIDIVTLVTFRRWLLLLNKGRWTGDLIIKDRKTFCCLRIITVICHALLQGFSAR